MIIKKSDKVNSIVLINKNNHLDKMYNILSDSKKFVKSSLFGGENINFIFGIENKLIDLLKELKTSETISEIDYKKFKPGGSNFGVLYGMCKRLKRFFTNVHHLHLFFQQSNFLLSI